MVTPTTATIPNGNSGTDCDGEIRKVVLTGKPGPPPAFIQQVMTWYTPSSEVEPVEGAPRGVSGLPPRHMDWSTGSKFGATGNHAALLGSNGPQPVTEAPPVVPVGSKNPGPPKGTVQNAVPPGTMKAAITGQPARFVHAYVKPEGIMTAVKNWMILSPVDEVNWF